MGRRYRLHQNHIGWVYLSVVIDLFNREVVGFSISKNPDSQLTMRTMVSRNKSIKLTFHSDRGVQYRCIACHHYLEEHQITSSISRGENPYDNACAESFFATLKKEWVHHRKYQSLKQIERILFEYFNLFIIENVHIVGLITCHRMSIIRDTGLVKSCKQAIWVCINERINDSRNQGLSNF